VENIEKKEAVAEAEAISEIRVGETETEEGLVQVEDAQVEQQLELSVEQIPSVIEAMLFVYAEPLSVSRIIELINIDETKLQAAFEVLRNKYSEETSGLQLVEIGMANKEIGYQLRSKAQHADILRKLKAGRPRRLSKAALETLSIVAYRQPIVKSDIEKIRGVDSSPTIKTLIDKKLIKIIGHQASVGQPALYATTDEFLSLFSLKSISDLPTLRELKELENEPGEAMELPLSSHSYDPNAPSMN
jgi:segregation and condensation protein B